MKILVLGATGMLGHKLAQELQVGHELFGTVRATNANALLVPGIEQAQLIGGISTDALDSFANVIDNVRPDVVLNCVGVVKQIEEANDPISAITINALLPHQLARKCASVGARFIHFSTDCVFSGNDGPYAESDIPDATDLYGRTKLLGEVDVPSALTLRTSIVGRELKRGTGLFEWFFSQKGGHVKGYSGALYTGLTTNAMSEVARMLIEKFPTLCGVWQVSSDPISKLDLLRLVNRVFDLGITIEEDCNFHCDRRLDSSHFRAETNYSPPSWAEMIEQMHADPLI